MNHRPPAFFGRSDLETLLASENPADWIRISEWFLGPTPKNFAFVPKHTSNAYSAPSVAA
jgi:tRNA-dihydrouridine synthase 3